MIRISRSKLLFIHIPKTAGSSITSVLMDPANGGELFLGKHSDLAALGACPEMALHEWSIFTVIRNPFEQVLSFYHHLRKPLYMSHAQLSKDYPGFNGRLLPEWACEIAMSNNFSDYARIIYSDENKDAPQARWFRDLTCWFLPSIPSVRSIDFIRHENLVAETERLFARHDIIGTLKHLGASSRLSLTPSYHDVYCQETRSLVEARFCTTLEMFNYGF